MRTHATVSPPSLSQSRSGAARGRAASQPRTRGAQDGSAQILRLQGAIGNRALGRVLATGMTQRALARDEMRGGAPVRLIQRDAGSEDYATGYQDGLAGNPSAPAPRDGDALVDYNEGYLRGAYEANRTQTSSAATDSGPTSSTPAAAVDASPRPVASTPTDDDATPVGTMDVPTRLLTAIEAAGDHLGPDVFEQLAALTSPAALAVMAAFVASQFVGLGEVADAAGIALLAFKIGTDAVQVATDLKDFFVYTVSATTRGDLKKAGAALAHAIVLAGIDVILVFLGARGRGKPNEPGGGGGGIPEDPWPEWPSPGASAQEARQAAEALEAAARAKAAAEGGFTPSWAVEATSQGGWEAVRISDMTPAELDLVQDVMAAPDVIVGRSMHIRGRGQLTLDEWLVSKNIQWTQRWQDVYNHSLYLRTSTGSPVNVMPGAGYSSGEVGAAERGATVSGVKNAPYWPDPVSP